jgi:hypothetical protein
MFPQERLLPGAPAGYPEAELAEYMARVPDPSKPAPAPPAGDQPKAAYTPPPPPTAPPPPPSTGPQGNLKPQAVLPPTANPAVSTAGAVQMFNWAKDFSDRAEPRP